MKKASGGGMPYFNKEHWEADQGKTGVADLKYTNGSNPEELKKSVNELASFVKKNKMKY